MPTEQPSNAPDDAATRADDADTAVHVLSDDRDDATPGGGGLGGARAADALGGSARGGGGASPNAPIDTGVSGDEQARAEAESRIEASRDGGAEPKPIPR